MPRAGVYSPSAMDEILQVYDQRAFDTRIRPAWIAYYRLHDAAPLLALLEETVAQLEASPVEARYDFLPEKPREELARLLATLETAPQLDALPPRLKGLAIRPVHDSDTTRAFSQLIDVLCIARIAGKPAELDLRESPLRKHLYDRSDWIRAEFDGTSPSTEFSFEPSHCSASGPLAPHWVARFEAEVKRAGPPPAGSDAAPYHALLLAMLELVRSNPVYRLVLELC